MLRACDRNQEADKEEGEKKPSANRHAGNCTGVATLLDVGPPHTVARVSLSDQTTKASTHAVHRTSVTTQLSARLASRPASPSVSISACRDTRLLSLHRPNDDCRERWRYPVASQCPGHRFERSGRHQRRSECCLDMLVHDRL